jgi:plastocyanin
MERGFVMLVMALVLAADPAVGSAADRPVVVVAREGLRPARLVVHVGEIVTWQLARGTSLRFDLEGHPEAHELVGRPGEIRSVFLTTGEHPYTAIAGGRRRWRGTVVVEPAGRPWDGERECGLGRSDRVCVAP